MVSSYIGRQISWVTIEKCETNIPFQGIGMSKHQANINFIDISRGIDCSHK